MSFTRESVLILVVLPALGGGSAKASDSCLSFAASTVTGTFTDSGQALGNSISLSVALGDLDGDGDLDAMVGNAGPNRVWINDGTGTFTDSGQALGDSSCTSVALGDLDGDGDLDAMVGNYAQPNRVWINDGTGTFTDSGQALGNSNSQSVALGDLDGDGDLDAMVAIADQPNRVWINDGTGTFTDSGQALGNSNSQSVALGDLDGDGDLDAMVGNFNQPNRVWINDGAGTFTDSGQALGNSNSTSVALGDLDGDGDLDAMVANALPMAGQPNRVWLNDGTGTFTDSGQALGNSDSSSVALGDLNGDGDLDAMVGNFGQPNRVWLNDGTGTFTDSGQALGNSDNSSVALGDLDGDGDLDAMVGNFGQPNRVWLNGPREQALGNAHSLSVALGDLDGDGDLDAMVANGEPNGDQPNRVWLNDGTGTFTDSGQALGNSISLSVALGDLDGDGDLDAMVGNYAQPNRVWLNNGTGTFTDSGQALGNSNSQSVALGDLDGDGDLDAMVANDSGQANRVWINDGTGTFTDSGQALGNSNSTSVALGDLDGDGDLDAMVGNYAQPNRVWINDGTGTFTDSGQADSGQALGNSNSYSVAVGDFDGDGDLDAMVGNYNQPNRVWINDGDSIQGTLNVRLGLCFDTVAEAIDASIPNDTLLIGGASLDVAGTIDLRSRPLTFKARSSAPIVGPDLLLLAGSTSSFVSAYDTAFSRYRLQGTMAASNDDSILLSDLQIEAGGTLVQNGSSLLFEKGMHNQGGTAYLEGDLFCFDGEVSTGSAGRNRVAGDTNVLGDYTNAGTTIVQRGILYIYGDLENTGTLTGEVNTGFDGGGEPQPGDGFSIGGSYRVGADANLAMPDPVWQLQVGGDVDIAIDDPARFDMGQATIRLTGLQAMETLSEDLGAAEQGFDPSNFPIGMLRITSDSATTLVNNHVNSTADPCEALYVERLVVEKGAFLWTNGCRIYTREAEIFGEVDGLDDIVIVEGCPGDLNGDGMVGPADLSLLFGVWNTDGSVVAGSDIDGDGLVDGSDLGVMLIEWGLCL